MTTPDQKAAAFDPDIPLVATVGDLTAAHAGSTISTCGATGELIEVDTNDLGVVRLVIREPERTFDTTLSIHHHTECEIVADAPSVTDVVSMDDFYALARELDRVSGDIRSNDESTKSLKQRKQQLSEQMLAVMARVGQSTLAFDDRRAYLHHELYPEFEEKEDGSRYGYADLVPVLKAIGRAEQVTPETVNYRTVQGILREIHEGIIPMPPELAAMVKIGEKVEVRTGVGRKPRR